MPRDCRLDLGIHIGRRREHLGLTGTEVAAQCGATQSEYSNWERCKSLPKNEAQVRQLAMALGLSTDYLVQMWRDASRDMKHKGPAKITRAYNVTSGEGGSTTDVYNPRH